MKQIFLSPLLALVLLPPFAVAQRGQGAAGSAGRGNYGAWTGTVIVGRGPRRAPGAGQCGFGDCVGRYGSRRGGYGYGYGWPGYYAPYSADYDDYWTLQDTPPPPAPPAPATPSVIVIQAPEPRQQPTPVEPPKLVEVSSATDTHGKPASSPTPAPPAIFILSDGEHLQATRYTLTYDSLEVRQGRGVRVVPLSALNLDATLAANHQHGLDLQIPENRQQITLGF